MYQHFDSTSERNMQPKQWGLTEDNLRTHTLQVRCDHMFVKRLD
jgi:hypothetical protein